MRSSCVCVCVSERGMVGGGGLSSKKLHDAMLKPPASAHS